MAWGRHRIAQNFHRTAFSAPMRRGNLHDRTMHNELVEAQKIVFCYMPNL